MLIWPWVYVCFLCVDFFLLLSAGVCVQSRSCVFLCVFLCAKGQTETEIRSGILLSILHSSLSASVFLFYGSSRLSCGLWGHTNITFSVLNLIPLAWLSVSADTQHHSSESINWISCNPSIRLSKVRLGCQQANKGNPATLSTSSWGIPRSSQPRWDI